MEEQSPERSFMITSQEMLKAIGRSQWEIDYYLEQGLPVPGLGRKRPDDTRFVERLPQNNSGVDKID